MYVFMIYNKHTHIHTHTQSVGVPCVLEAMTREGDSLIDLSLLSPCFPLLEPCLYDTGLLQDSKTLGVCMPIIQIIDHMLTLV